MRSSDKTIPQIASDLGISEQSSRNWVRQADIDDGRRQGLSTEERDELRRLRRENRILVEEREILEKAGAAFFAKENEAR